MTRTVTKKQQLQRGSRGIFIGFAPYQAGYLLYIEEPIGTSHLITSHDVAFDDDFLTSTSITDKVFHGGRSVRPIGKGHIPSIDSPEREQTGDVINTHDILPRDPKGLPEEGSDGVSTPVNYKLPRRSTRVQSILEQRTNEQAFTAFLYLATDLHDDVTYEYDHAF